MTTAARKALSKEDFMYFRSARHPLVAAAAFLLAGACSGNPSPIVSASGSTGAGTSGNAGAPVATTGSSVTTAASGVTTTTSGTTTTSQSGTTTGSSGTTTSA